MFDYYGVSQRVAAVRMSPWRWIGGQNGHYEKHGDEFTESYTYGPVGATTRTVETEDADPGDNFDHWVLPDVFGGTTGLWAQTGSGPRDAAFQHFDAFGVRVGVDSTWSEDYDGSRYRWRSQEGSETDDLSVSDNYAVGLQPPALVYMQTRHYDPSLGRFIMADSIPMGAFSPQGLNRYAYCTNDPVNLSDATGRLIPLILIIAGISGLATGLINVFINDKDFGDGFIAGFAGAILGALLTPVLGWLGPVIAGGAAAGWLTAQNGGDAEHIAYSCFLGAVGGLAGFGAGQWGGLSDAIAGSLSAWAAGIIEALIQVWTP